jgi:ScaI restriction endonuclease
MSSHPSQIFGNRSYAQEQASGSTGKGKSGYYLTVNFQNFKIAGADQPSITQVRFGWLDHTDWIGQASATGQQARFHHSAIRTS